MVFNGFHVDTKARFFIVNEPVLITLSSVIWVFRYPVYIMFFAYLVF